MEQAKSTMHETDDFDFQFTVFYNLYVKRSKRAKKYKKQN